MGWELFAQGGLMMYPLAVCSILALAIALERGFALRRSRIIRPEIVSVIENIQGPEDIGLALSVCKQYDGPFSSVMRAGLDNRKMPLEEIRESIIDQGRQEMGALQKGLVILETVAGVSPLLGLLGTVLGMIRVFQDVSEVGVRAPVACEEYPLLQHRSALINCLPCRPKKHQTINRRPFLLRCNRYKNSCTLTK